MIDTGTGSSPPSSPPNLPPIPTPSPTVPDAEPDEQTLTKNLLHAVIALLPIFGVAVPAVWASDSTLTMVAGALVSLLGTGGVVMSLLSHAKKNAALKQTRAAALYHKTAASRLRDEAAFAKARSR